MSVSLIKPYRFPSLTHYAEMPVGPLYPVGQYVDMKPNGLWISDDSDYGWKKWSEDNEFRLEALDFVYDIQLKRDANIIWLRSEDSIDRFTVAYGVPNSIVGRSVPDLPGVYDIDWGRVAELYQGILISPYQPSRRLERQTCWYYGWDVASGCIWNPDAVESVTMRPFLDDEEIVA